MYVCMYVSIYLSIYLSIYVSMYLCIYLCMYVCMYVCNVCMYVCMHACMHACMHVCMYVCNPIDTLNGQLPLEPQVTALFTCLVHPNCTEGTTTVKDPWKCPLNGVTFTKKHGDLLGIIVDLRYL